MSNNMLTVNHYDSYIDDFLLLFGIFLFPPFLHELNDVFLLHVLLVLSVAQTRVGSCQFIMKNRHGFRPRGAEATGKIELIRAHNSKSLSF